MKTKLLSIILLLTMIVSVLVVLPADVAAVEPWDGTSSEAFEGKGSLYSPYVIRNANNLKYLQEQVIGGNSYAGQYIVLSNNIDLAGYDWIPIGSDGLTTKYNSFSGVFNGNGFSVKGLTFTKYIKSSGLFCSIASTDDYDCVIANLTVEGNATIDNDDAFSTYYMLGGISGYSIGEVTTKVKIYNCVSNFNISVDKSTTGTQDIYVGGLVGKAQYTDFIDCVTDGSIDTKLGGSTHYLRTGGLVGANYNCTYTNCINKSNLSVIQNSTDKHLDYVGGLVGVCATSTVGVVTTFTNCVNMGSVYAENLVGMRVRVGGIIGSFYKNQTTINNCYNIGEVTGKTVTSEDYFAYVGGIAGYIANDGDSTTQFTKVIISDSYNNATIYSLGGKGDRSGGIVGVGYSDTAYPNKVENCQTTTDEVTAYSENLETNCTANISTETFAELIAPIDTAIETGTVYDFTAEVSVSGDAINVSTSFRGAARLVEESNGLRFTTEIKNSYIEELNTTYGVGNYTVGTIIAPLSYVNEAGVFTIDALDALTKTSAKYLIAAADVSNPYNTTDDGIVIAGSIANIKEANYDVEFAAIAYVYANGTYTYSNVYATRSIAEIAEAAFADTSTTQTAVYNYEIGTTGIYSPYTTDQQLVLGQYIVVK